MFNPEEHLMNLKGKQYLQVAWRIVWFRQDHPDWCIQTELLDHEANNAAVFKASIFDREGTLLSTGYGSESVKDFRDYLEKAETKAVGRALAMLGYGTQFVGPEFDEGERIVDTPMKVQQDPVFYCADCGKAIEDFIDPNGKTVKAAQIADRSMKKFNRFLCVRCGNKANAQ